MSNLTLSPCSIMVDVRGGGDVYLHVSNVIVHVVDNNPVVVVKSPDAFHRVCLHGDTLYALSREGVMTQVTHPSLR